MFDLLRFRNFAFAGGCGCPAVAGSLTVAVLNHGVASMGGEAAPKDFTTHVEAGHLYNFPRSSGTACSRVRNEFGQLVLRCGYLSLLLSSNFRPNLKR